MDNKEDILSMAGTIRAELQHMLKDACELTSTDGSCAMACVLLHQALERFSPFPVAINGGAGELQQGYRDAAGRWFGHFWVEVEVEGDWFVLDITADQFGGPEVVFMRKNVAYNYKAGCPLETQRQIEWLREWVSGVIEDV